MRHEGANKSRKEATGAAMGGDDIGGRGGITQGISFEFFESFLLIYSHNTHWANFEFFSKIAHHFDQNLLTG